MQDLIQKRTKTKWLKYIFLSTSICILISLIVTIYVQKLPIDNIENIEPQKKFQKNFLKATDLI